MDQHVLPKIDDDDEPPPSRIVDELDEEDYEDPPASPLFTMTCGLLPASMCGGCMPEDLAEQQSANAPVDLPVARRGSTTLSRSRGRVARASWEQHAEVRRRRRARRGRGAGARSISRATSVKTDITTTSARTRSGAAAPVVIVNSVPARDLDSPRATSEFHAYLERASCAIVAVDYDLNPRWSDDAAEWVALVKDARDIPVALLVSTDDHVDDEDPRVEQRVDEAYVAEDADAFCARAEVVGWYRHHPSDPERDETRACMAAVLGRADGDRVRTTAAAATGPALCAGESRL
ncbi:hypothetical protein JL722_48 [Aureococcus anophagefferens]|nr:hypothetical protein JL722_48 [Aureococcus anophagefferens]